MLVNDKVNQEYRVSLEGDYKALARYSVQGNIMTIFSTQVPEALQGKGYGKLMMETILPEIEREGFRVVPACSYVAHYLNRSPQWQHLLAD